MNNNDDKRPDDDKERPKRKAATDSERSKQIMTNDQKSKQALVVSKGNSMECKVRVIAKKYIGGYHRYYGEYNKDKIDDPMKILFEKYCAWWDCNTKLKMSLKKECLEFLNNHFEWVQPIVSKAPVETLHINQELPDYAQDKWVLKVYKIKKEIYKELLLSFCPQAKICEDWISIADSTIEGAGYGVFAKKGFQTR